MGRVIRSCAAISLVLWFFTPLGSAGESIVWTNGAGTFKWNDAGNWSLGRTPVAGDSVVFSAANPANCDCPAGSVAQNLASITLQAGYNCVVSFSPDFAEGWSQVLTVTGDIQILSGSVVACGKVVNSVSGTGVTLNCANLTVASGAALHSDGKGFPAQEGPLSPSGQPTAADTYNFGASHGGRGYGIGASTSATFGSPTNPVTLGPGGSSTTADGFNRSGGGAIKISASGTVTVNGRISCNALDRGFHNTGAGGSLQVSCSAFSGVGLVQARGGNISTAGRSAGGGGRIAVSFATSTFTGAYDVSGGKDPLRRGRPGTVSLPGGSNLTVKNGYKVGLAPGSHVLGQVTVETGGELFAHSSYDAALNPTGCVLNAASVTVFGGGSISAEGEGYAPLTGAGSGTSSTGASHGGRGAGGKAAYGIASSPVSLGSGGNADWSQGNSWGGGALKIAVGAGAITVNGVIEANALAPKGSTGGAAGGSLWLVCGTLSGGGSLFAKGCSNNGGGGRIAIYPATNAFTGTISAAGAGTGEAGSVLPGSLALGDAAVLATDAFPGSGNFSAAVLHAFRLQAKANTDDHSFEPIQVTRLVADLTSVSGVASGDLSNVKLFRDYNTNGVVDGSDTEVASSAATVSIPGSSGTIEIDFAPGAFVLDDTALASKTVTAVNTTTEELTSTAHGLATGQALIITSTGSLPGGLAGNTPYFARAVDANKFTLHGTRAGAINNTGKLNLTGAGSGTILANIYALDYLLLADVANVAGGDGFKVQILANDARIVASGTVSGAAVSTANAGRGYSELTGATTAVVHEVPSASLHHFEITATTPQNQGYGWQETISARDAGNGLVDTLLEVTLSNSGAAKFYTNSSYTVETTKALLDGGQAVIFVKDNTAQTITLTAVSGAVSGTSGNIVVSPTPVHHYTLAFSSPQTAGVGFSGTVTARDAAEGLVPIDGNVTLSSNGAAVYYTDGTYSVSTTTIALSNGSATLYVKDNISQSVILSASDANGKTGASAAIVIDPAPLDHYAITAATPRIKGQGFAETLTARDAFGNLVAGATNSVALTQSGSALFYTDATYAVPTAAAILSAGTASLYVKDDTLETILLTATDAALKTGSSAPIAITLSIQQRIDLASPGGTIIIQPGEYHEVFTVNKPLTISTPDPTSSSKPIIDGDGAAVVCQISASDVTVEGLEFRDATGDLVHSEGLFQSGGVPHANTFYRLTVRHCALHDCGGDGIQLRNVVDATVSDCLVWDVDYNAIFMDGVGNATVRDCEVKGAGIGYNGLRASWCYPATIENNYIHDLYLAESALTFADNFSGNHSVRGNVLANCRLQDLVSWHPAGGSALVVRKPTQNGTTATVAVEHNSIFNNTGQGPLGVTGHAIAWDWNGAANLTMTIKNNLSDKNSGSALATRIDSVNYGFSPGGIYDFNDHTEAITHPFADWPLGTHNLGAPPIFLAGGAGRLQYRLDDCPAKNGGDDGRDIGCILNDANDPLESNVSIALRLGASDNRADNLVDTGAFLQSTVTVNAVNPWGYFPQTVRVYLAAEATGSGTAQVWDASEGSQITFVDVAVGSGGTGSASFKVKGTAASAPDWDVAIAARLTISGSIQASDPITVLTPGSYTLVTTTFTVKDGDGLPVLSDAFVEVAGLGTVPSAGTLSIRSGENIQYRPLCDYGEAFGRLQAAGSFNSGTVTAINNSFETAVCRLTLRARDESGDNVPGAYVEALDGQGRHSGFLLAGSRILLPAPGVYQALSRIGTIESDGTGVSGVNVTTSTTELVALFRTLSVKAKDQDGTLYTGVNFEVGRGPLYKAGGDGLQVVLPVGSTAEVRAERFGVKGAKEERVIGPADTELVASLRKFTVTVKDLSSGQPIADGSWRLLASGFEAAYKGDARAEDPALALAPGALAVLEGFKFNAVKRVEVPVSAATSNVDILVDLSGLNPVAILSAPGSVFSPAFVEGTRDTTVNDVDVGIVSQATVNATLLGNTRWYGYVALDETQAVTLRATATNKYGQSATADLPNVAWERLFVGSGSSAVVPDESEVLLTTDASGVPGAASIDILPGDGRPAVNIAIGAHARLLYSTPGVYTAQAMIKDAQGQQIGATRDLSLTVVAVTSASVRFACGVNYQRTVWWDVLPPSARSFVTGAPVDETLLYVGNMRNDPNATQYPNRLLADIKPFKPSGPLGSSSTGGQAALDELTPQRQRTLLTNTEPAVALRVGPGQGWIPPLPQLNINEFNLTPTKQGAVALAQLTSGSWVGGLGVRMVPTIPQIKIRMDMMGGAGVQIEGASYQEFMSETLSPNGERERTLTDNDAAGSACWTLTSFQTTDTTSQTTDSGLQNQGRCNEHHHTCPWCDSNAGSGKAEQGSVGCEGGYCLNKEASASKADNAPSGKQAGNCASMAGGGGLAPYLKVNLNQPATTEKPTARCDPEALAGPMGPDSRFGVPDLTPFGSHVQMCDTDGSSVSFEPDGAGGWKTMPGESPVRHLTKVNGEYVMQGPDKRITSRFDGENGRLKSVEDLNGNKTEYRFDDSGVISQIQDSYGKTLTVNRTAQGHKVVSPAGRVVTVNASGVTGGPGGDVAIQRDANGRVSKVNNDDLEYDSSGRVSKIIRPLDARFPNEGREIRFAYTATTMKTTGCCTGNAEVTYTFDPTLDKAWTKREQDWNQVGDKLRVTMRSYNAQGFRVSETDADGILTSYTYNSEGQMESRAVGGSTWQTHYNSLGLVDTETDAKGNTINYSHDGAGNLTGVTTPDGATYGYAYNSTGLLTHVDMPLGSDVDYTYDNAGYRSSMTVTGLSTEPGGGSFTKNMSYDSDGMLLSQTDFKVSNKRLWKMSYDNRGNLITKTGPLTLAGGPIADETASASWSYNSDDQLVEHIDESGARSQTAYDLRKRVYESYRPHPSSGGQVVLDSRVVERDVNGNVTKRENALGFFFRSEYNVAGFVLKTYLPGDPAISNDHLNFMTTYDYGTSFMGRDTTVTDANLHGTETILDAQFRVTDVIFADGTTEHSTYDAQGNRLTHKDRADAVRSWTYDSMNRVDVATAADLGTVNTDYDLEGRVKKTITKIDATQDMVNETVYSQLGRVLETLVNGIVRSKGLDFDGNGNALTIAMAAYNAANPSGAPTYTLATQSFDGRNLLKTRTTDPGGFAIFEQWEYDLAGRQTEYIDGRGKPWETHYHSSGLVSSQSNGNGESTSQTYDLLYRPVTQTNARGFTTSTQYNPNGWVDRQTRPNGDYTKFEHDFDGNVTAQEIFDSGGVSYARTLFGYNSADRVTLRTALLKDGGGNYLATGLKVGFTYDGVGRVLSSTRDPGGLSIATGFLYDGEGRTTRRTRPDGAHQDWTYSYVGGVLTAADEAGRTTTNTFDSEGRLVATTAPGQAKVEYVYDQAGNLLKLRVDEDSLRETDYAYDILNRKTLERFPAGQGGRTERTFAYDNGGNVSLYTDGRGVSANLSNRDGVGRILTKTFSVPGGHPEIPGVPVVGYSYDLNGNLTGLSNTNGSCSWGFDNLDRLSTESVASGPSVTYGYDPRGVVLTETAGSYAKLHLSHTYDAAGRRLSTTQDGQTTSFEWDNAMRRTKVTLPNGVETAYTFDPAERIDVIQYKKGTVFENYDYSYDTVGNPTSVATSNGTYAYGYDAAYRLTSESRTTFQAYSASHTYDSVGNRLTRTIDGVTRIYSYNKADQLTGWTQGTKEDVNTFDMDGNMVAKQVKTSGVPTDLWSYDFDAAGRMASGTQSIGGTQSTSNTYVGDQWYRVQSTTNGTTLKYGWKRDALFAEFEGTNLVAGYLNDGVDQPLYKTRFSGNGATVDGRDFYHKDANWRVHHVTDGSGVVSEKYVYNAYGRRTILDSANVVLGASGIGNRIGFQGREHEDVESEAQEDGLTFHRNRFLDPDMGRWERRDPIGYRAGVNVYRFNFSSPARSVDPMGLKVIVDDKQVTGKEEWAAKVTNEIEKKIMNAMIVHSYASFTYWCPPDFLEALKRRRVFIEKMKTAMKNAKMAGGRSKIPPSQGKPTSAELQDIIGSSDTEVDCFDCVNAARRAAEGSLYGDPFDYRYDSARDALNDRSHESGIMGGTAGSGSYREPAPGDWAIFKNPDDYLKKHPGGNFPNVNAVMDEDGTYLHHPLGDGDTANGVKLLLVRNYNLPGKTKDEKLNAKTITILETRGPFLRFEPDADLRLDTPGVPTGVEPWIGRNDPATPFKK